MGPSFVAFGARGSSFGNCHSSSFPRPDLGRGFAGLWGLFLHSAEECVLVCSGHDEKSLPKPHTSSHKLAANTGLLVNLDAAEVLGTVIGRGCNTVKRAHVNAHAAAVTVIEMDNRDGPPQPVSGQMSPSRRCPKIAASGQITPQAPTVNAQRGVNVIGFFGLSADGFWLDSASRRRYTRCSFLPQW